MDTSTDATERDLWFLGTYLRILADSTDTDGRLGVFEQRSPRGFSPPRHVHHREDTALIVLEGEVTTEVGGELNHLGPGGFVWLPRDVPHTFRIDSDEARTVELITPAGFERFHVDAGDRAPERALPPPSEPDIERVLAAIGPYGAEIVGPPLGPDE